MADIIQGLIAEVSEGIHGPAQPGDPHVVVGPEAAADAPHAVWDPQAEPDVEIEIG
jgi:hypothetical protein